MDKKEVVAKAIDCCADFLCDECPFQIYDDNHYRLRCIHRLMIAIKEVKDALQRNDCC